MKNAYSNVINIYVERIKEKLNDDILMILIIGSSSSNMVVEGWSDIDTILVIKDYNFDIIDKIKKVTKEFSIKIGTTIFTEEEFLNKRIDPKTYYHIYLLQKSKIDLQYKKKRLKIPEISFDEIQQTHIPHLNDKIHFYKRLFLYDSLDMQQVKSLFKTTYIIMKTILILDGYTPRNYDEVFTLFSDKYNYEYLDYKNFIRDIRNDNEDNKNIIEYGKRFIQYIVKYF